MDYRNPELIDKLAAEYVLGTLRGKARDRFETLMYSSYQIRLAVWNWETQIGPLGTAAPERAPPKRVWRNIREHLHHGGHKTGPVKALRWWRDWGFAPATAAILLLLVSILVLAPQLQSQPEQIALFTNENAQPQWLVSVDLQSGKLTTKALNASALAVGQAFELWALPESGAPQSLGLMPVAGTATDRRLPDPLVEVLKSANGLAVSIEPAGGSPTGQPTGPVVFQSPLVEL
jgi:anti-sigma-K factor RskA